MGVGSGFDSGFSSTLGGGPGFGQGFIKKIFPGGGGGGGGGIQTAGALFSNLDTYVVDGTRGLHAGTAAAGSPAFAGVVTRINITRTVVLTVTTTVTVQGFKFVRVPEPSGNWGSLTDDLDAVLTVKSGGSINGGAISSKTFATNAKFRTTSVGRVTSTSVNDLRNDYDLLTVYDASAVTLTAGTYTLVFRGIQSQIGLAHFWTANIPIPTTTTVYPTPSDAANTNIYPVMEVLSTAP